MTLTTFRGLNGIRSSGTISSTVTAKHLTGVVGVWSEPLHSGTQGNDSDWQGANSGGADECVASDVAIALI